MVSGSVREITKMVSFGARNTSSRRSMKPDHGIVMPVPARPEGGLGRLHACQRVPHVDAFAVRLADVKVARQHGLHVLEHRIEIVAINRRVVVAACPGKTMRKV